jgi:localization factor PodJL
MTTGGPWSVKGIDPKAREIAKDLARRSGMTLGEWLNHMIVEGGDEPPPEDPPFDRAWLDAPRTRSAASGFSATESLRQRLNRDLGARDAAARDIGPGHNSEAGELQRIGKALAELSQRLESSEQRSTLALSGIDQQTMGVLARIEGAEREQTAVAARFDVALDEVRSGQARLNERLRRFDGDEAARMEAVKALEGAITKVAGQIYEGEARARTQISELREDIVALARRVDRADQGPDSTLTAAMERKLEALAADLTARVEKVRAEVAGRAQDAADGKLDRLEGAMREVLAKVGDSEKRASEAVDRMGREVMRVAQSMNARVQAVEQRSSAASDQMGSEMARIAEAMEGRMRRADAAQAEALEKLGGEIARIAEKLAERIAVSERRSSGAITHMGDQLSGVTEAFNQRHERASADIAERIRLSEERTAKLLAETRETIDRRLGEAARPAPPPPVAAAPVEPAPMAAPAYSPDPFGDDAAGFDDPFSAGPAPAATPFDAFDGDDDFAAEDDFAPRETFAAPSPVRSEPQAPLDDLPEIDPPRRATRDLIASARAAARAASEKRGRGGPSVAGPFTGGPGPAEFAAPEVEAAAGRARTGALGFGFPLPRKKKAEGPTLRTFLMASGVAAALSVTAVGAVGLAALDGRTGAAPKRDAQDAPTAAPPQPKPDLLASADAQEAADAAKPAAHDDDQPPPDRLAMAVAADTTVQPPPKAAPPAPAPAPVAQAAAPAAAPPGAPVKTLYSAAVRQIEGGDASGVEALKKAANLGYAPAEFYLAKLFETGGSGVKKDAAEARRWTDRAAQAGDAKAMHNLALYWFEGAGGPKDPAQAADWFKRAAERGVQDSQYNLARLYEQGFGVGKNMAEAYKWYLVAGAAGDPESKSAAEAVKRQLSPEAQAAAERAAASFRTQIAAGQQRAAAE